MKRRLLLKLAVLLVSLGGACAGDFEDRINEKRWIREYYNEVIQKRDRDVLLEYVPLIKEEPYYIDYSPDGETKVYWYDDFPRRFDRVSCSTEPAIGGLEYINVIRIWGKLEYLKVNTLNPNLYEVWIKDIGISQYSYERELKYGHNLEFALSETEYPLYFKFDGEYLFIYLKDQKTLLSTYCAYDESEYQALVEAIAANVFDVSKFTFPRHADGSCDYDEDTWKSAKKPSSGTSLRTGKSTTVKENLHVHSFDSATSPVSITLAAGTLVEILGVGGETYASEEARAIDEQILCFVPESILGQSEESIENYVSEVL